MLRNALPGASEALTAERLNRVDRETLAPAARPVAARIARDASLNPSTSLDRPRFLWPINAKTCRVLPAVNMDCNADPPVTGPQPFVAPLPGTGKIRRIACRDLPVIGSDPIRIRVRLLDATGGFLATVMDGTTSLPIPFDVRSGDTDVGVTHRHIDVACLDHLGAVLPYILNVTIEQAVDLSGLFIGL